MSRTDSAADLGEVAAASTLDVDIRIDTSEIFLSTDDTYVHPKHVTRRMIASALYRLHSTRNSQINLGRYDGGVTYIHRHRDMPRTVVWAARIDLDGAAKPFWATMKREYGLDFHEEIPYWLASTHGEHS
jgi:hypothetical protein